MIRRTLLILSIIALLSTACAGSGSTPEAPAAGAPTDTLAPVTLTLWHPYGGTFGQQFEALVREFNKTHPGIVVEPSYGGNLWTMRDKLLTAIAGQAAPDLSMVDQFWSSELADAGALVPMETFIQADPDFDREDIWPMAWKTATYDGTIWTMPFSLSNIALYYNRRLFREAGLDPDRPPTTWEELATMAQALTADRDGDGQPDQWGLSFPVQAKRGVVYYWFAFLWQAGGEIFNDDYSAARFQESPGIEALRFWQTMVEAGSLPLSPPDRGFEEGQIGMLLASTARLNRYIQALGDDLGVAPLPAGPAGAATGVGGANIAILSNVRDREAAWAFVRWMTSPEVNRRWSTETGYLPLRRSVVESAEYRAYLEQEPRAQVIVDQMAVARVRPNIPAYAAASREIGLAVEEALFTGADPAQVLTAAAEKVNALLSTAP